MNRGKQSACIELIKGLAQCEANIKAMNLRALLGNSNTLEEILKATSSIVLSWLDPPSSGLTDDEVLRLRAILMKVQKDKSWYEKDNPGKFHNKNLLEHL